MGKFIDLTGEKYGRLLVLKRDENKIGMTAWICICDCGNIVSVAAKQLRRKDEIRRTRSCGCYKVESFVKRNKKYKYWLKSYKKAAEASANKRKSVTQCLRGHKYNLENTYINKRGHRSCRECNKLRMRQKRSTAKGWISSYLTNLMYDNKTQKKKWLAKKKQIDKELKWLMNSEEQL